MTEWLHLPGLVAGLAFVIGTLVGSFINLLVYRLPLHWTLADPTSRELQNQGEFNLLWPRSQCPACRTPLKAWQIIPILGYFLVGRHCRVCQASVSGRYPLVEMATGLLTWLVIIRLGVTPEGIAGVLLTWVLVSLALIDYDTQLLPDSITLPMLWLGLIVNLPGIFTSLEAALVGACLGYLSLWGVYHLFKLATSREGMGYGDFKLLALLGAWLGWQSLPLIILLSSLLGALVGGFLMFRGHDKRTAIAFGPCLAIAGWGTLLWGADLMLFWQMMMYGMPTGGVE